MLQPDVRECQLPCDQMIRLCNQMLCNVVHRVLRYQYVETNPEISSFVIGCFQVFVVLVKDDSMYIEPENET